jgi:hypothetical protein
MPAFRERLSDALLRFGTDAALDRTMMERSLLTAVGQRGGREALGALEIARWVDSAALWMSWRLRPRNITP